VKLPGILSLVAFAMIASISLCAQTAPQKASDTTANGYQKRWWKEAVVYQIYPRSFQDSNGDGIGDLPGITKRLDYLQQLGVNVIWLSPHYDSPNADNGYDIRDYEKVMPEFGTMADFDALLKGIKQRHMRLILDLVVNHSSDEHRWFVESRKSKDNPFRDYYIWKPGKDGHEPNNWTSFFSGSAWKKDDQTGEYYLHYFAEKQPDLNWENPKLRQEVYGLMKFWLDKGVDGFRMDVIPFVSKDQAFADLTPEQLKHPEFTYAMGPRLHEYLQEMNREVLQKYDVMTVGEAFGVTADQTGTLVDERRKELNMVFQFDAVRLDQDNGVPRKWTLPELKAIYTRQDAQLGQHAWNTIFLSNHDNPRLVSSFGDDSEAYRVRSAKLLATMLLTLKGTPFIYQGDELGMTNYPFKTVEDFDVIQVKNYWKSMVATGKVPAEAFLAAVRKTGRDNARTPMQWERGANGGFTTAAKPWLAVNPNYTTVNAKEELAYQGSVYHYYKRMIALRQRTPALVYGDFKDLDPASKDVFAYTRVLGDERYLVVLNFTGNPMSYELPGGMTAGRVVMTNLAWAKGGNTLQLGPWEARVYRQ
jgi:oligo-1,6-glucosidase